MSGPAAPHIEYLPRSATPASRRTRPPSSTAGVGRPHTAGSFFSLTRTVIEEEEGSADEPTGPSSFPVAAVPARRSRSRPSRPRRAASRHRRPTSRRRTDSAPGGLSRPAVFVHRVNGGQGAVWGRPGSAPLPAAAGAATSTIPSAVVPTAAESAGRPATAEPRPTYRDWPLDRLRHLSAAPPVAARPRPRARRRSPERVTPAPATPGGGGGGMTRLSVGSAAPLLWPQRREDGARHSDVLEQEGASFSSRYLHPQDLSTVL